MAMTRKDEKAQDMFFYDEQRGGGGGPIKEKKKKITPLKSPTSK